ncbi:MAG: hypothetical protein EBR82_07240 [Caulobacteraceae bacterium]|nr:hypothetical protein [Caulobacteraceae bacterium]
MPFRGSVKNFFSAQRAPFAKRFGLLPSVSAIDKDFDNDYSLTFSTANGASSIQALRLDASNRLILGYSATSSALKTVRFVMNANAGVVDQTIWISDGAYEVISATEIHSTAGTDGGAVTLDIDKDTGTQAPTVGASVLSSTFNLKGTANTLQTISASTTPANAFIAAGDRISINITGVTTSVAGVVVVLNLAPGYSGDQASFVMNANAGLADQCFFTATKNMLITRIDYVHSALGTDASAVNVQVTKDTGTAAPGAGTDLLTNNSNAGFDCKGAINTVQNGTLTATAANLRLAPGDRLSVDFAGTLTALAGVVITVTFAPYFRVFDVVWNMNANSGLADQCFFTANRPVRVVAVSEVHSTLGTDGSAVNVQLTLDRLTDAPGAGTDLLSNNANAGFNLKGTINTVQTGTFISDWANTLLAGDRLSLDFAGTLTAVAGVQVTVTLQET